MNLQFHRIENEISMKCKKPRVKNPHWNNDSTLFENKRQNARVVIYSRGIFFSLFAKSREKFA